MSLFSRDLSDSSDDEDEGSFSLVKGKVEVAAPRPGQEGEKVDSKETQHASKIVSNKTAPLPIVTALSVLEKIHGINSPTYAVDNMLLALMSLVDEYQQLQHSSLQKHISDGFFNASLAKYKQTSFSGSFPQSTNLRMEFEANVRLFPELQKDVPPDTSSPASDTPATDSASKTGDMTNDHSASPERKTSSESDDDDACGFKTVGSDEDERSSSPQIIVNPVVSSGKEEIASRNKNHSEAGVSFRLESKQSLEDYLLLFHGLPSTKLKQCQKDVHHILSEDIVKLSLLKQQISLICNTLEEKVSKVSL